MISGLKVNELVLPEQKELAHEVAELVMEEVRMQELNAGKFKNFLREAESDVVMTILDSEDSLLATGTLVTPFTTEVFVTDVVTAPLHRQKGIGRILMTELEKRAMLAGAEAIRLVPLDRSRAFYEGLGYTPKICSATNQPNKTTLYKRLVDLR